MIRRASINDIEPIKDLLHQVCNVHADGRPDLFKHGGIKYTDDQLVKILEDEMTPVYVFEDEAKLVCGYGFCEYHDVYVDPCLQTERMLYIDDICVDENHRRQGIAGKIFAHIVEESKKVGTRRITLNVWECNPGARAFYDSLGMKPLKTTMETLL